MRKVLLALALLAMVVGVAKADEHNLADGVLIAHYVPELGYTTEPPALGWCGEYLANYAIDNCDDQNNRIDVSDFLPASWFVLAAWGEEKTWCAVEFGFGEYNPDHFVFGEYNPCFPQAGLEITTPDWPGPGEGIALAVSGHPWQGNFGPVIHFGGYAYGYGGETMIPLDVDPPTGFAGTANCVSPPEQFAAVCLGGLGINMDGIWCCPPMPEPWVCCDPETGACEILFEEECLAQGWDWRPDLGQTCDPNPCPPPVVIRACCFEDGSCALMERDPCAAVGGIWHEEWDYCDPNPCPQPTVCCVDPPEFHGCVVVFSEQECMDLGGIWHPEWTSCDPNHCAELTGTDNTSWGSIKGMYR